MERQKESTNKGSKKRGEKNGRENNFEDKRKFPRVSLKMDVEYRIGNKVETATSTNISGGGIFIQSKKPLPVEEPTSVRFMIDPEEGHLEIPGKVAWIRKPEKGEFSKHPGGMGVKFIFENNMQEKKVANFVRDLSDLLRIMEIADKKKKKD